MFCVQVSEVFNIDRVKIVTYLVVMQGQCFVVMNEQLNRLDEYMNEASGTLNNTSLR